MEPHRSKLRNLLHTALLITAMAAVSTLIAWLVWGKVAILWTALLVGIALTLSQNTPTDWVLSLLRAAPLDRGQWIVGHAMVDELVGRAGLTHRPRLYYLNAAVPNAISLGRGERAAIVITRGLLRLLTDREIAGVLAHEISHFRNNDIGLLNLAAILANLTFVMATSGLLLVALSLPYYWVADEIPPLFLIVVLGFAPHGLTFLALALSRTREFDADLDAAALTGDPVGLASALEKLELSRGGYWHVFLSDRARSSPWLRSHPSSEERIRRLLGLAER